MAKSVTMRDIANKVGVSTVTVSKALSDKEGVGNELRNVIIRTAEEMNYHYTSGEAAQKKAASYTIGVIVADNFMDAGANIFTFYMKMYHSIITQMKEYNCSVVMEIVSRDMLATKKLPDMVIDKRVDGIIVLGYIESKYLNGIKKTNMPMVYLDFYDRTFEAASIVTDNMYGTYMLTDYVVSMGHEKIAFVGNIKATPSILDRYLGYYRALLNNNIELRKDYIIDDRDRDGYDIEISLPKDMPTAFVCNCDQTATRLIEKLVKNGYKVPEDISVVGFDNYSQSTYTLPRLTTVEVNVEEMTKTALDIITRVISGDSKAVTRKVISGKLIVRDSVRRIN